MRDQAVFVIATLAAVAVPVAGNPVPEGQFPAVTAYHTSPGLADPGVVPRYGVFELTLAQEADYGEQKNFADVEIRVTFTNPAADADIPVGGFYYDTLPDRTSLWKARFAPSAVGRWVYRFTFTHSPSGNQVSGSGAFDVVPGTEPGFLRIARANPYRFVFDDGRPFAPIGFNDCFGPRDGRQLDGGDRYGAFAGGVRNDEYFAAYGEAGFNLFRFSQSNCSPNLTNQALTRYDKDVAVYFDWLVQELRTHDFRVFFGLFGFLLPNDLPDPPTPEVERFVEHSVDRWGAYVDVWEIQNERRASDGWIAAVSSLIRERDPYDHPITTSWQRPELDAIEINAPHWYQYESEYDSDRITANRALGWRRAGKPVVVGEQGNSVPPGKQFGNWLPDSALRMRLRSWTALFHQISFLFWNNSWATNGSGGGASNLYVGHEERQYVHVLQWFARAIDRTDLRVPDRPVTRNFDDSLMRAYALTTGDGVAVYLHHFADHANPVRGETINVDVPREGAGRWIDPATGRLLGTVWVGAGPNAMTIPDFVIDIAFFTTANPDLDLPPIAVVAIENPQADGDLDEDGQIDRGPAEPPFGVPPLTLILDGSGSYDPDGGGIGFAWNFGDGTPYGTGPIVTHTYGDGNFLTTFTVTDDEGDTAQHSFAVRATGDPNPDQNDPPTLNALRNVTVREGELVLITPIGSDRELVGGSYNVDGHTTEVLHFKAGEVPPGARFEAPSQGGSAQLWWVPSFTQSGVYEVEFRAEDPEGATSEVQRVTITVLDAAEAAGPGPTPTPTDEASPTPDDHGRRIFLPFVTAESPIEIIHPAD